jgi:hypothetical protein
MSTSTIHALLRPLLIGIRFEILHIHCFYFRKKRRRAFVGWLGRPSTEAQNSARTERESAAAGKPNPSVLPSPSPESSSSSPPDQARRRWRGGGWPAARRRRISGGASPPRHSLPPPAPSPPPTLPVSSSFPRPLRSFDRPPIRCADAFERLPHQFSAGKRCRAFGRGVRDRPPRFKLAPPGWELCWRPGCLPELVRSCQVALGVQMPCFRCDWLPHCFPDANQFLGVLLVSVPNAMSTVKYPCFGLQCQLKSIAFTECSYCFRSPEGIWDRRLRHCCDALSKRGCSGSR